jgi:hypothetical protein
VVNAFGTARTRHADARTEIQGRSRAQILCHQGQESGWHSQRLARLQENLTVAPRRRHRGNCQRHDSMTPWPWPAALSRPTAASPRS